MDAKQILEQEAKRHGLPLDSHIEGQYAYPATQWLWLGIQAAIEQTQPPAPSDVGERVAIAICEERTWPGAWQRANDLERDAWRRDALAALAAMPAGGDVDNQRLLEKVAAKYLETPKAYPHSLPQKDQTLDRNWESEFFVHVKDELIHGYYSASCNKIVGHHTCNGSATRHERACEVLREELQGIIDHYPDPNIDHVQYRVHACRAAQHGLKRADAILKGEA